MNNITIVNKKDFLEVIDSPIVITKNKSLETETDCNMWTIDISEKLVGKLSIGDLESFIADLLKKRSNQLLILEVNQTIIFYLCFDAQALQLRFNLISSINTPLPFGCKLIYLETYVPILQDFIETSKRVMLQQEQIEYINPEDDSDDDDDEDNFILSVYVVYLEPH